MGVLRSFLVALPIGAAVLAGCATARQAEPDAGAAVATTLPAGTTRTTVPPDYAAKPDDFVNVHDMTEIRGFFVDNLLGHLDETLDVANSLDGGVYPVGTVIQLIPQEAMVKRAPGFAPDLGDWEFFQLRVSTSGTEIKQRGTGEIKNLFNQSCGVCHMKSDPRFDFVCEKNHGCDPLPLSDDFFKNLQRTDPRPRRPPR